MDIAPLTATQSNSQIGSAAVSGNQLAEDFDTFLTLLTTQLQNQDPTDPMDSNEFTNQLVQFSGVEQQIQTNENLEILSTLMATNTAASAAGFLGKEALIVGDTAQHDGSGATWRYNLPASADSVILNILDETGVNVYSAAGDTALGNHIVDWDGIDNTGSTVPNGHYTLNIEALTPEGGSIDAITFVQDTVHSYATTGPEPIFNVGANAATYNDILQLIAGE